MGIVPGWPAQLGQFRKMTHAYGMWAVQLREELDLLKEGEPKAGLLVVEELAHACHACLLLDGVGPQAANNTCVLWSRLSVMLRRHKGESYFEWYRLWELRYNNPSYPGGSVVIHVVLADAMRRAELDGAPGHTQAIVRLWGQVLGQLAQVQLRHTAMQGDWQDEE